MKGILQLHNKRILQFVSWTLIILLIPNLTKAQKDKDDINIEVNCVEYAGNGKLLAHFGYENTGKKTVVVAEDGSMVTYNHGQSKKLGLNTFEPGIHENAFTEELDLDDRVIWQLILPNGKEKVVDANIHSNHCRDDYESLNIIPGYFPPEGGKEYNTKIGAELTALYNAYSFDPAYISDAPEEIFRIEGTRVLIEVVALEDRYEEMISELALLGFDLVTQNPDLQRATGWVEIADLMQLNEMDPLYYARPVYPGVSNYFVPATGLVNSQGDFAMHSDFARLGYDLDGSGVKIGVLSNSYDTQDGAELDVENGDLPGPDNRNGYLTEVEVLLDIDQPNRVLSDEGRAMLQIVHDIAPGAALAFRTGFLGELDMALGIQELADAGCDIIVDDLSYITEPFFRDGLISKAIDRVVGNGVTFFSSAGNFGRTSYMADYNPHPAPSTISGTAHDFGNGDIFQQVRLEEGNYTLVLQWDDGSDATMNTTETDLDLFLSDEVGFALLGFNRENVGGFPIEVVPFSVEGGDVIANVVVARASGTRDVKFKYMLFRGSTQFKMLEYGGEGSSTIVGHPNAAGAIAVGAVRFDKNPIWDPQQWPEPVIMSWSSMGGTPVMVNLVETIRDKPDFTAPNGVNTTVDLGNGDWDDPIDPDTDYPNFFGTSAASPHAAGMAALIMEATSRFEPEVEVTPAYIRNLMKSTTIERLNGEVDDFVSGSGFIQAHRALMTFANPKPYVKNLILAEGVPSPGETVEAFSFTIEGDFFTESTEVWMRGEALNTGIVLVDESTITVDHEGFIGNPEIRAFNPVISSSEKDGGYSEGIYFSDPVKQTLVITADPATKKYGEAIPVLSGSIRLQTGEDTYLTLQEAVSEGLMLQAEANRLSQLSFNVAADENSDVGQYFIEPAIEPPLDLTDPKDEIEYAISEKYLLETVHASLTIEKIALKITPADVRMVYGEIFAANGLGFYYEIVGSIESIVDTAFILQKAKLDHTTSLSDQISLIEGITMVNGIPMIRGMALVNGVPLLRGVALVNGVEVRVETEGEETTVYVDGEPVASGSSLIRGIALVNGLPFVSMTEIVRGIALVNGSEVTFEEGFMTHLDGEKLANSIPAVRGIALVNEPGVSGEALVNGADGPIRIIVDVNGITTINGADVPLEGIAEINGIPTIRGLALVNSGNIIRGLALVNDLEVAVENGIPTVRGIALVNGIPMSRGIALVNNLEVHVEDGEVSQVYENGVLINGLDVRGIALVNEVALVNGTELINRGLALVNGIALTDEGGDGDETDLVNLENMNMLASNFALTNGSVSNVRGIALVNGMESMDGHALNVADGTILEDGTIVYENVIPSRGIALVNGLAYSRGLALVNGSYITNDYAVVNSSSVNEQNNSGTILVFDATEISAPAETGFRPISFITGTTAGQHWIVPGTFLSKNFDLTYGLGKLIIDPLETDVTPTVPFICINEGDALPEFEFEYSKWITGDNGNDGYIVLRDSDGIPYDPLSDESAGTYSVYPSTFNDNYSFNVVQAVLHVNPFGPGTRAVKPELNCVEELSPGLYRANLEYKNDNDAAVYIPEGSDNDLTASGLIWPDGQVLPTMFAPGGGSFYVHFTGEQLSWIVNSLDEDHKVSSAANANSNSTKCTNTKSAAVGSGVQEEELDPDLLLVYPNPVAEKLHVTMKGIEQYKSIMLLDITGKAHPITSIEKRRDNLEIDMEQLSAGYYFIKILMEDSSKVVQIVKE